MTTHVIVDYFMKALESIEHAIFISFDIKLHIAKSTFRMSCQSFGVINVSAVWDNF